MNKKVLWLLSLLAMVPFLVSGAYEWLCQTVCDGTILAVIWMGVLLLAALCHTPFGKRPVDDEMNRQKLRIIKDTGIALLLSCLLCLVALILGKTLTALGIREELPSYHIIALSVILLGVLLFFLYAQYSKPCASPHTGTPANEEPTNTTSPNENNHDGILLMLLLFAAVGCQILTPLPMHLLFLTAFALLEIHVLMPGLPPSIPQPGNDLTDLLGREKVVRDCAERLKTHKKRTGEACNLALTGSWGSGKTFIMKLVHHELQKDQDIHVIPLNLWHLQTLADIHKAVIQAIYSTVHAPSCFSSPALLWCLRSIASLCDAQSSTRFSEALERLVLNPGSMHTAGDVAALNTSIRKPVIIFLDDLERLNKNVLEQVLPMIDSLSQVNNLRFFVAINTETFNEFKTTRTEAAGYFHKVFTERIDVPPPDNHYFLHLAKTLIERQDLSPETRDFLLQLYGNDTENCLIYFPQTPRTMLRAFQSVLALIQSVAKDAYVTVQDRDYYTRILRWSHFFTCLEAEFPELYSRLKYTDSTQRANTLIEIIGKYVSIPPDENQGQRENDSEKGKEPRYITSSSLFIHPSCPYVAPIRYILRFCDSVIYHSRTNKFELPRLNFEDLNVNLDGGLYSALSISWQDILKSFRTAQKNNKMLDVGESTNPVYQERRRIFWTRAMEGLLRKFTTADEANELLSEDDYCDLLTKEGKIELCWRPGFSHCLIEHVRDFDCVLSLDGMPPPKYRLLKQVALMDHTIANNLLNSTYDQAGTYIEEIKKSLIQSLSKNVTSAIISASEKAHKEIPKNLVYEIQDITCEHGEKIVKNLSIDWEDSSILLVLLYVICWFSIPSLYGALKHKYSRTDMFLTIHELSIIQALACQLEKQLHPISRITTIPQNFLKEFKMYEKLYDDHIDDIEKVPVNITPRLKQVRKILDALLKRDSTPVN